MISTISYPNDKVSWKKQLMKELKGVSYEELIVEDRNGIKRNPFYVLDDINDDLTVTGYNNADWEICVRIEVSDVALANKQALDSLKHGASGLIFTFADALNVPFEILFQGIGIQYIYIHLIFDNFNEREYQSFIKYLDDQEITLDMLNCSISFDPVSKVTKRGFSGISSVEKSFDEFLILTRYTHKIYIDGLQYHNAGATSAYELGCILAHINEYLSILFENGSINLIKSINVSLAVGTDFFEQISKLRAIRSLIACLSTSYGISPNLHLHVETSTLTIAKVDINNNLLRNAISGMAAVLGSCDSMVINPNIFGAKIDVENRLALTQQILFKEEAHLNKVAEIPAGSYFVETLTNNIGDRAWEHFQSIEKGGGLIQAIKQSVIQKAIANDLQNLIQSYKDGKRILVGVNKFVPQEEDSLMQASEIVDGEIGDGLRNVSLADKIL